MYKPEFSIVAGTFGPFRKYLIELLIASHQKLVAH
jgi:hypothetical protein